MDRRDVLKYTALFMGVSLTGGTVSAILAGCQVDKSTDWVPGFLTDHEAEFIRELGETILPKTNTPGAKDAMVDRFIDTIRPLRFSAEDNTAYKQKLNEFIQLANTELGNEFVKVSSDKKLAWVTAVDKASYEAIRNNADGERPFYLALKEQILGGYFSSEIVAKEYFEFDPNPGSYEACIPYSEIGRAWAL